MKENLIHYSEKNRLSALIRHADRDEIPNGSFGNDILISKKGKENSFNFGKCLSELKVNRIFTSPVQRCVQTAEQIGKGYGKSINIIQTTALGNPGLQIYDDKLAGEYFMQHGGFTMYTHFTQGREIQGVRSTEELRVSMTNFIAENTTQNGLTIFISHDMIIAMYHYCLDKTIYTKDNWVNFLSGITLKNGRYEKSTQIIFHKSLEIYGCKRSL